MVFQFQVIKLLFILHMFIGSKKTVNIDIHMLGFNNNSGILLVKLEFFGCICHQFLQLITFLCFKRMLFFGGSCKFKVIFLTYRAENMQSDIVSVSHFVTDFLRFVRLEYIHTYINKLDETVKWSASSVEY